MGLKLIIRVETASLVTRINTTGAAEECTSREGELLAALCIGIVTVTGRATSA